MQEVKIKVETWRSIVCDVFAVWKDTHMDEDKTATQRSEKDFS